MTQPARDSHELVFDPALHAYTLDGVSVPSVTKIVRILDAPQLDDWRARVGYAEAQRIATRAAEYGTAIHAAAAIVARGEKLLPLTISERFAASVQVLGDWMADNVTEVLFVEKIMASPRLRIAGKPDLICTLKGRKRPVIIDYKSGAGVYLGSVLQQAAYRLIVKEWHGLVCERLIIHMPAPGQGEAPQLYPIPLRRHSVDEAAFHAANVLWRRSQQETA